MSKKSHAISFHHAWDGLTHAFSTQPNFGIHLFLSSLAVIGGLYFRISTTEWLIIFLTIATGLVIELVNTAIESTVDLITSKRHPIAKIAKDTSAAAMLIYAVGAVVVASVIFLPKIWPSF